MHVVRFHPVQVAVRFSDVQRFRARVQSGPQQQKYSTVDRRAIQSVFFFGFFETGIHLMGFRL